MSTRSTAPTDGRVRAKIVARGRVQGVFYRDTLRRAAIDRGVTGSAVNEPDGTVLAYLEGEREAVESVIDVARTGPPAARVDSVEVEWLEPAGIEGFSIG